jgi:phosphate transport system substrate-binding protein
MPEIESPSPAGSRDFTFTLRIDKRAGLAIGIVVLLALGYFVHDLNRRPAQSSTGTEVDGGPSADVAPAPFVVEERKSAEPERQRPPIIVKIDPVTETAKSDDVPPPDYDDLRRALEAEIQAQRRAAQARELKVRREVRVEPVVYVEQPVAVSAPDLPDSTIIPANLNGAGATFPYPIYSKWFSEYHRIHPEVTISYQSIGSGGGIKQVLADTVDFGATDGPMSDEQLAAAPFRVLHVPTVLGAVVLTYNLPGAPRALKFTPDAIAGIFLGRIRKWNDPLIARANFGVQLPDVEIVVVHRSDGNAASYIFTDYLSKVSPEWKINVGKNTSVKWPVGLGGKGNEGVAGTVKQTPGSIGYVEFIYALAAKLPMGVVQNAAGRFITPALDSVQAAADTLLPEDFRASITNPPGKTAYPMASFTWLLVPAEWKQADKKRAFSRFLNWMLDNGEAMAGELGYAPLPRQVAAQVKREIREIQSLPGAQR